MGAPAALPQPGANVSAVETTLEVADVDRVAVQDGLNWTVVDVRVYDEQTPAITRVWTRLPATATNASPFHQGGKIWPNG